MVRALDEPTLELLTQRAPSETDAAVKYEIETGLALAALDGTDAGRAPRRDRNAARRVCARGAQPAGGRRRNVAGRHAGRTRRRGPRRSGIRPSPHRRRSAVVYVGRRDVVLRPQPRLGAGARGHRSGHHLRRDGRHQHGARRADDARRLHDLRRADADARAGRHLASWCRSPRPSSWPDSPASSSNGRSSAFSTAGRSKPCSPRSASAWCCSSSCARSSPPTTEPSKRRRG